MVRFPLPFVTVCLIFLLLSDGVFEPKLRGCCENNEILHKKYFVKAFFFFFFRSSLSQKHKTLYLRFAEPCF